MEQTVFYAIGEQNFRSLRKDECLYVDKTKYIARLLSTRGKYFFLARPRRFGKSLFLSTLRYFFEGQRELFKGLYIDSIDWDWGAYPVLYLDLNRGRYTEQGLLDNILENRFGEWEKEYGVESVADDHTSRFENIIAAAYRKTGKEVVILVDEYDKPLVGNLNDDRNFEHYRAKLASVYANFKSSAEYIKMVFLTGVSRFSKLSVFSDLNNLRDLTFDDDFADICGITEQELSEYFREGISRFADRYGISYAEAHAELKRNYDGYRFTPEGSEIYNPWSLLNAMERSDIGPYWDQTGTPTIIAEAFKRLDVDIESCMRQTCGLRALEGFDLRSIDPTPLLYQTGYLTIKHYDRRMRLVTLGVPNREVEEGLLYTLLPYYVAVKRQSSTLLVDNLIYDVELGRAEEFMKKLSVYFAGVPYELKMDNENNFHNAFYILVTLLGLKTQAEVSTSDGRIDLVIKTAGYIYIIELKYDGTAEEALHQIKEKRYDRPYEGDGRKVFKIGASFSSKTRTIESYLITE